MTLIECFDREPIRNIVGALCLHPDKLVFLGDAERMRGPVSRYRKFLTGRGMHAEVISRNVDLDDISAVTDCLGKIIWEEKNCVIDVTGGDERLLIAVGTVLGALDESLRDRVTVQKFDLENLQVQNCDGDGEVLSGNAASLTVRELIALHGGIVHPRTEQPDSRYTPKDIQLLWDTMCADPKGWNKRIAVLNEFESRSDSITEIRLSLDAVRNGIGGFDHKEGQLRELLEIFHRCGVVENRSSANTLCYQYLNSLLHDCVKKAGNILEIKTLLEARALRENGRPYFDDCQMSVTIDWDGLVHDPSQRIPETKNEIDVLLTRGVMPLFVSCKNGNIGEEELYKLNTVSERFGGSQARKMLIATDLDRKSANSNQSFIQRAKDMHIFLVTDAAELSKEEWREVFRAAMEK